jgi:tetratricopeptide (TPR) repeat protein
MIVRSITILLFVLIGGHALAAQDTLAVADWLEQRAGALRAIATNGGADFRPGWVEEIEIRTETDEFDLDRQEYLVRLSPSTPRIRRAQARLMDITRQELNIDQRDFQAEITQYVLEELFEIDRLQKALALQEQLLIVLQDEQTFITNSVGEKGYNLKDLIQVEEAIAKLQRVIQTNRAQLATLTEEEALPATDQLLSVPALAARLLRTTWAGRSGRVVNDQLNMAQVDAEVALEKAEQYRFIDFLQLRYNGPHDDLLQERVSVSLGVELPTSASRKLKLEELSVEKLILEQKITHRRTLDSLQVANRLKTLQKQINNWRLLTQDIDRQVARLDRLRATGVDAAYQSPDLFLFLQETILKEQLDRLDEATDVYRIYLALLDDAEVFFQENISWQDVSSYLIE